MSRGVGSQNPIRDPLSAPRRVAPAAGCRGQPIEEPRMLIALGTLIGLLVGGAVVFVAIGVLGKSRIGEARTLRRQMLDDAERQAETIRREAEIGAREDAVKLRAQIDAEISEHRSRIVKVEERVLAKEEEIDRKLTELTERERELSRRETQLKHVEEAQG